MKIIRKKDELSSILERLVRKDYEQVQYALSEVLERVDDEESLLDADELLERFPDLQAVPEQRFVAIREVYEKSQKFFSREYALRKEFIVLGEDQHRFHDIVSRYIFVSRRISAAEPGIMQYLEARMETVPDDLGYDAYVKKVKAESGASISDLLGGGDGLREAVDKVINGFFSDRPKDVIEKYALLFFETTKPGKC